MIKIVNEKVNKNGVNLNDAIAVIQKECNVDREAAKTLADLWEEEYPWTEQAIADFGPDLSRTDGWEDFGFDDMLIDYRDEHGQTKRWKQAVIALWNGGKYKGSVRVKLSEDQTYKAVTKYFNIKGDAVGYIVDWFDRERRDFQEFIPFLEYMNDHMGDKLAQASSYESKIVLQELREGGNWTGREWDDQDYEEKGVKLKRIPKECIKGATILSLEEAQSLPQEDLMCRTFRGRSYWLRTPDSENFLFAVVSPNGKIVSEDTAGDLAGCTRAGDKYYDEGSTVPVPAGLPKFVKTIANWSLGSKVQPQAGYNVRPALVLSNIKSAGLKVGDFFAFGGQYRFKIVKNNLALCEWCIPVEEYRGWDNKNTTFDSRCWQLYALKDNNEVFIFEKDYGRYKGSLVEKVVDEWFDKFRNIEPSEDFIKGDGRKPWLHR